MENHSRLQNFINECKNSKSSFKKYRGASLEQKIKAGIHIEVNNHGTIYECVTLKERIDSIVPIKYQLDNIKADTPSQQAVLAVLHKWVYPGLGLYIYGNMGSGKTTLLKALEHDLRAKHSDLLVTMFEYPSLAKGLANNKKIERLSCKKLNADKDVTLDEWYNYFCRNSDILLIDDFLRTDHPFHPVDNLLEIFNYRERFNLPTFFTSNLSINGVMKVNAAIAERLLILTRSMECITDESYRLKKQREYQQSNN